VSASAPLITNVEVASTTEDSATIQWVTDVEAIGMLNYGKRSDYGIVRNPAQDVTDHQVVIEDLEPSTTYHFRVTATDDAGNQGISGDFTFTTGGTVDIENIETVSSPQERALVEQAVSAVREVTDPNAIRVVQDEVQSSAEDVLRPPSIIGAARIAEVGMDFAVITWSTNRPAGSEVAYATDAYWQANQTYSDTRVCGWAHDRARGALTGLEPATTYHFQVQSVDEFDLEGLSTDNTFETKSRLPQILDIQLVKVEETSATLAWSTDLPASGAVEYENLATGEVRSEGSPESLTTHTVRLSDLTLGTTYVAQIRSTNDQGDSTLSDPLTFTTVLDEEPPLISKVTNESTLFPGAETRIQTIVDWETDELATCQMFFRQGIQESVEPFALDEKEDPSTEHVQVVVEFQPATVYQFWVECTDLADNTARSENFVLFTPQQEKNIIDIILENFEGAFGWVNNIGG